MLSNRHWRIFPGKDVAYILCSVPRRLQRKSEASHDDCGNNRYTACDDIGAVLVATKFPKPMCVKQKRCAEQDR
jgi:hypothetical protein